MLRINPEPKNIKPGVKVMLRHDFITSWYGKNLEEYAHQELEVQKIVCNEDIVLLDKDGNVLYVKYDDVHIISGDTEKIKKIPALGTDVKLTKTFLQTVEGQKLSYISNRRLTIVETETNPKKNFELVLSSQDVNHYIYVKTCDVELLQSATKEQFKELDLQQFGSILVRNKPNNPWRLTILADIQNVTDYPYVDIAGNTWADCIPYLGSEYLLGKITYEDKE